MLGVKQEVVNTNFKDIDLTRLEIKPATTAEEDDPTTQPFLGKYRQRLWFQRL